jgi:competence protein ComEC
VWIIATVAATSSALGVRLFLSGRGRAPGAALLLAIASAGGLLGYVERTGAAETRLKRLFAGRVITADDPVRLTGRLILPPEPAPGAFYLDVEAESLKLCDKEIRASGGVRLMARLSDAQSRLEFDRLNLDYGSRVSVLVRLARGQSYGNPGSPDFNEFLERNGFDLTGIIKSPLLIERLESARATALLGWLYRARLRAMDALDARFKPDVAGTLKAMLMGNRYFLNPENAYRLRESSTFHIISISGMHVSLMAWAMLGGWSRTGRRRRFHVLAVLIALWLYALMVGLQPPVARATAMISVGLIGPMIFRRAASLNTVALAAFFMLGLNPSLVADAGFQLSFIAVAAIVAIAMPLAEKLRRIGQWRPAPQTPRPPQCPQAIKILAECLFWNERTFRADMSRGLVQYRLDKSRASRSFALRLVQPLLRWLAILVITSASAQLATLPLSVFYFNRIAPVGILINVLAGLLSAAMMLGAIASAALSPVSLWLAEQIETVVSVSHLLLVQSAAPFAEVPGATFRAPHFEDWRTMLYPAYFALLGVITLLIDRWRPVYVVERGLDYLEEGDEEEGQKKAGASLAWACSKLNPARVAAFCGAGLMLCVSAFTSTAAPVSGGKLVIHFLDVGQGDSALVVFPQGATMLVDAGGEIRLKEVAGDPDGEESASEAITGRSFIGEMVVSRFLWSLGITRIDYAIVTHSDRDHIGGFPEIIRNFSVGQVVFGGVPGDNPEFNQLAAMLSERGIPAAIVSAGESFNIEGVTVEVLWPALAARAMSENDRSVVIRLVYGSVAALLTGDIERVAETALLESGRDLRADLLKVPHHGSNTSSGDEFLRAVDPASAVISVGERSPFGHPHKAVVDRFLGRGIMLYRTGQVGTVSAETGGESFAVTTYRR